MKRDINIQSVRIKYNYQRRMKISVNYESKIALVRTL